MGIYPFLYSDKEYLGSRIFHARVYRQPFQSVQGKVSRNTDKNTRAGTGYGQER